jgi:hypothetical protein
VAFRAEARDGVAQPRLVGALAFFCFVVFGSGFVSYDVCWQRD